MVMRFMGKNGYWGYEVMLVRMVMRVMRFMGKNGYEVYG